MQRLLQLFAPPTVACRILQRPAVTHCALLHAPQPENIVFESNAADSPVKVSLVHVAPDHGSQVHTSSVVCKALYTAPHTLRAHLHLRLRLHTCTSACTSAYLHLRLHLWRCMSARAVS